MRLRLGAPLALTLAVACGGVGPVPDGAVEGDPLGGLAWLAGRWVEREGDRRTEEQWLPPAGATMLGVGRTVEGARTVHHEWLRIEARGAEIVYVASPATQSPADFTLVSSGPASATFEDLGHDYPQRIVYTRTGDRLEARIEDAAAEDVHRWTFTRAREGGS